MGREGEGIDREEQDESRQGRAKLKCGGKPILFLLLIVVARYSEKHSYVPLPSFLMVMNLDGRVGAYIPPHMPLYSAAETMYEHGYHIYYPPACPHSAFVTVVQLLALSNIRYWGCPSVTLS